MGEDEPLLLPYYFSCTCDIVPALLEVRKPPLPFSGFVVAYLFSFRPFKPEKGVHLFHSTLALTFLKSEKRSKLPFSSQQKMLENRPFSFFFKAEFMHATLNTLFAMCVAVLNIWRNVLLSKVVKGDSF